MLIFLLFRNSRGLDELRCGRMGAVHFRFFSEASVCVCGGGEGEGDLSCRLNGNISEKQALISDISQFFLFINESEYQPILSPY